MRKPQIDYDGIVLKHNVCELLLFWLIQFLFAIEHTAFTYSIGFLQVLIYLYGLVIYYPFDADGVEDDDDEGPYQGKFIGTLNSFHHQVN